MANKEAILDKIARNLKQRGLSESAVVRNGSTLSVTKTGGDVLAITYVDKSVQSPMGGVSASSAPFLGMGIAAPGTLKVKGATGETTIAGVLDTVEALQVMAELTGFGNDVVVESGSTTTELARISGVAGLLGLGS
jgi:hypothetical protein